MRIADFGVRFEVTVIDGLDELFGHFDDLLAPLLDVVVFLDRVARVGGHLYLRAVLLFRDHVAAGEVSRGQHRGQNGSLLATKQHREEHRESEKGSAIRFHVE